MAKKFFTQIAMQVEPTSDQHVTTKRYVDRKFEAFDFQGDILNIQEDATLDPGASPQTGDRYILTDIDALHANFGTITKDMDGNLLTLADNDIVEHNGDEFRISYDVSTAGEGAMVWNRNSDAFVKWTGTSWSNLISAVKYTSDFNDTSDWTGGAAPYTITKSSATHGLGATKYLSVAVYEDGSPNTLVSCDVTVADNGSVVVSSDSKFAGHMVIM
jgi:hypothetical protein